MSDVYAPLKIRFLLLPSKPGPKLDGWSRIIMSHACPKCGANAGDYCVSKGGHRANWHADRKHEAREELHAFTWQRLKPTAPKF